MNDNGTRMHDNGTRMHDNGTIMHENDVKMIRESMNHVQCMRWYWGICFLGRARPRGGFHKRPSGGDVFFSPGPLLRARTARTLERSGKQRFSLERP